MIVEITAQASYGIIIIIITAVWLMRFCCIVAVKITCKTTFFLLLAWLAYSLLVTLLFLAYYLPAWAPVSVYEKEAIRLGLQDVRTADWYDNPYENLNTYLIQSVEELLFLVVYLLNFCTFCTFKLECLSISIN